MEIIIDDTKTIAQIRKEFNDKFPYLKIEFFKKLHKENEASPRNMELDHALTIGQIRAGQREPGHLRISKFEKVSELEKDFMDKYGLSVQVFRKAGDAWIETIFTDHWTLAEQNTRGEGMRAESASNNFAEDESFREQP